MSRSKHHYTVEQSPNARVIIVNIPDSAVLSIDTWQAMLEQEFVEWQFAEPMKIILDVDFRQGGITPRSVFCAGSLAQLCNQLPGEAAIVIQDRQAHELIIQTTDGHQPHIFTSQEDAMLWLTQVSV